jgi:hypothetical protein
MQYPAVLDSEPFVAAEPTPLPDSSIQAGTKPRLDSHDSAPEFSLERFVAVYRLLEIEEYEVDRYVYDDSCLHVA